MVERAELALERTEPEKTIALVTKPKAALAIFVPKTAPSTTPIPISASATTSQDILATLATVKTLLPLTSGPQFDRIALQLTLYLPSHQKVKVITLTRYLLEYQPMQTPFQMLLKFR